MGAEKSGANVNDLATAESSGDEGSRNASMMSVVSDTPCHDSHLQSQSSINLSFASAKMD